MCWDSARLVAMSALVAINRTLDAVEFVNNVVYNGMVTVMNGLLTLGV